MPLEPLTAISAVDGRYRSIGAELTEHFSEFGLIRARLLVETEYLIALSEAGVMRVLSNEEKAILQQLPHISTEEAQIVKKIEKEGYEGIPATNHDVKAIEYFIKKKLADTSLADISEWTHFALTSEDVNSIAYAVGLRGALQSVILPALEEIQKSILFPANMHAATPMLARTHGQPATPTTFGKEMKVFESRLARQMQQLQERSILVKFAGATGNFNAHVVALPDIDWQSFAKKFVARFNTGYKITLELNEVTTQIEPRDTYAELFDNMRRINTILIDFSQDIWRYISDGWLIQKVKEGEVGSSAMPHKVNPIDFENAEGNFGVANALFEHFSRKLPISRLQRDLSDSTVLRAFGTAFGHSLVGYRSLLRGAGKITLNETAVRAALDAHPEVIAEAIQTVLRKEGVEVPYEKLKELTRGQEISLEDFATFIDGLSVSDEVKTRLKALRPENYIGLAEKIALG
ncbi:adenylosuccinate lyase [Candidatus Kaiserbacteria bacterium RIFCSPHIGHO2_01_FULL_54_36]|uniref:Adenylosuccinate lyase n=1 Tax=Candidatus Kaiserbacteria bacterium RIFCSPHIGHO2_01_FULL_54_36 TaxID=1798482 RepID=A0A1F6CMY7_9BACT|nr:MAG: adenylosuccinate lyase [Candidatus Kaiserbacteria bacterium RIFCSPHIGHO2_01_FULL_54_36]OGG75858.1 MAG: adenylosuccinate lyase [Candidatus Kaiserbacteria bacterium RIFCSPLOWO2_01_FULL_54_22]